MSRIVVAILVIVGYLALGAIVLSMQMESIQAKEGQVWTANQRAIDVLDRLEQQVMVFMADRKDILDKIVAARTGMQEAQDTKDFAKLDAAFKIVLEAYPDVGLSEQQTALMDETAGSINRITYARDQLINAQQGYNSTRIIFFPLQIAFPRVEIVGEDFDPTTPLPQSHFGTPAPKQ